MSERDVEGVPEPLVVVYAGGSVRAGMIHSLLEAEGLHAFLRDQHMGLFESWVVAGGSVGAVKVVVPSSEAARARELLQALGEP